MPDTTNKDPTNIRQKYKSPFMLTNDLPKCKTLAFDAGGFNKNLSQHVVWNLAMRHGHKTETENTLASIFRLFHQHRNANQIIKLQFWTFIDLNQKTQSTLLHDLGRNRFSDDGLTIC